MTFTSEGFILFLVIVWLVYFIAPRKARWAVLLMASYTFYLLSDWRAFAFIVATTVSVFLLAQAIGRVQTGYEDAVKADEALTGADKKRMKAETKQKKKRLLVLGMIFNFGILLFLKYAAFTVGSLASIPAFSALSTLRFDAMIIPLGISFYTFQAIGYLIDVYRDKYKPESNVFRYALFVSFFPQLIQGPISRYNELAPQLYAGNKFDFTAFTAGVQRGLWGAFKKLVIADRLAFAVNLIFGAPAEFSGGYNILAVVLFSMQLYMDFSGGIDMTIGIAQSFGITLAENFRQPFFAKSMSEFWQRWHATLGSWMRDYVFYSLSFSAAFSRMSKFLKKRIGKTIAKTLPSSLASLIVFLIVGVWHGANWTFIVFGLYHGIAIAIGTMMEPVWNKATKALHIKTNCFSWGLFQALRTYVLILIGQFFARASSVSVAWEMLRESAQALLHPLSSLAEMAGMTARIGLTSADFIIAGLGLLAVLYVSVMNERHVSVRAVLQRQNIWFRWAVYLIVLFCIIIVGIYGIGYDAASFIYGGV